jgi:hypothetical protein
MQSNYGLLILYCCLEHWIRAILLVSCKCLKGARRRKRLNGFGVVICRVIELDREDAAFGTMPIRVFFESKQARDVR